MRDEVITKPNIFSAFKKGNYLILTIFALVIFALLLMANPTYAHDSETPAYGPIISKDVKAQSNNIAGQITPRKIEISDEHGKKVISQKYGPEVASRLKYRVKKPITRQFPQIKYTKASTPIASSNWSGYIAQSANVHGVSGEFNAVPCQNGWDAAWSGIGGFNGINLAQTGIDQKYMAAWTEVYPAPAEFWFNVNENDQILSAVLFDTDTGCWYLFIGNLTSGYYYDVEYDFDPDPTTAEWIVERVGNENIGTFNTVNFNSAVWYDANYNEQNMSSDAASVLYKCNVIWNDQAAGPSAIGADGQSFSVSRLETLTVSNPSPAGFTVGLSPALNGLTAGNFILRDSANNLVPITGATTSDNGAIYTISASLAPGQAYTVNAVKDGYDYGSPKSFTVPAVTALTLSISDPSTTGFKVGLSPALNGLTLSSFTLRDSWNSAVSITSAATTDGGATYTIGAALKAGETYTVTLAKTGYDFGTEKSVTVLSGITFAQGDGYQAGAYDLNAAQPTVFNWTRQSQFNGPLHPALKWAYQNGSFKSLTVVGSDGTVYVTDKGYNKLTAVNANGSLKWNFSITGFDETSAAIGNDGTLYIGEWQGGLYAINPDGSLKWHFGSSMTNSNTEPVIASDGTVYFAANDLNVSKTFLYAIDSANGSVKWSTNIGSYLATPTAVPAIACDGTVYVIGDKFYAIAPDGSVKWATGVSSKFAPVIAADGTVYVGADRLYAFNPGDGGITGSYPMDYKATSSPAIAADGTIYISAGTKLYAFANGVEKWSFSVESTINSAPLVGRDGSVYVVSSDGYVYAIDPNGSQKWVFQTITNFWVNASLSIGSDGTLFIGAQDSKLYAIGEAVVPPVSESVTVSNSSATGFVAGLSPALSGLTKDNFFLRDSSNNLVAINEVITSDNGATYTISTSLAAGQTYTITAAKNGYDFGSPKSVVIPAVLETLTVSNPSTMGFIVGLNPALNGLTAEDFILRGSANNQVAVSAAATYDNGATYAISASLAPGKNYTITAVKTGYGFSTADVPVPAATNDWVTVGSAGFSAGNASSLSIAMDPGGTPYVVYQDGKNGGRATVQKYNGSSWLTVGSAGFSAGCARNPSMAIDSSGIPYVVYQDDAYAGKATVKKYNGISWVTVGSAGFSTGTANYTAIAIDGGGTPYVVYNDIGKAYKATVKKYDGSSWETVGSESFSAGEADYTAIAIDNSGTPYVVYQDLGFSGKATVKKFNGDSWVTVGSAGFSAGQAGYTSIGIDQGGIPYVVYGDGGNAGKTTVQKYNGSSWVTVGNPGFSADKAYFTSLAIDSRGIPYVAYQDAGNASKATAMSYDGSNWVTVGRAGFSLGLAYYTSIAINSRGVPFVAYSDFKNDYKATVMEYNGLSATSVALTASNPSSTGFIIGLDPALAGLTASNFVLCDSSHNRITNISATTSNNGETYRINAFLSPGRTYTITAIKDGYDFGTPKTVVVPLIPVILTVSEPSVSGFRVALSPATTGLDFMLRDSSNNEVTISQAMTVNQGATYWLSAALTAGQAYSVTAMLEGYDFGSPQNFQVPNLSLKVTYDGNENTGGSLPIDSNSYAQGTSVTVLGNTGSLVKTNYVFDGWSTSSGDWGTDYQEGDKFEIINDTVLYAKWKAAPAILQFSSASYMTEESDYISIEVIRSNNLLYTASVEYLTYNGSAVKDEDYEEVSGMLTFEPGEVSKTITIPMINDSTYEIYEHFYLKLANPAMSEIARPGLEARLGEISQAVIFIKENDYSLSSGTVKYFNLEGGFYGIIGDDGVNYRPIEHLINIQDGDVVRFGWAEIEAEAAGNMGYHMWGKAIRIIRLEVTGHVELPVQEEIPVPGDNLIPGDNLPEQPVAPPRIPRNH